MHRSTIVLSAVVACSFLVPSIALAAGEGNVCTTSYEKAQYLRRDKKLRAARKELLTCSQTTCAAAIVSDCTQWMSEVDKIIPSVVFDVRDTKGQSIADAKVSMDGEVLQTKLDGTAIQVDPGNHTFHFDLADGTSGDQQMLVLEGEKARVITYTITGVAAGTGNGQTTQPPQNPPNQPSSGGSKTLAYVVGGVGVASLAVGIIFGAMGSSQASSDKASGGCAPKCGDDEVSSIKTKLIMSDIFIPVGIVGIGAGVVLYLVSGNGHASASATTGLTVTHGVRLDASPTRDGATFGLHGSF
ncbi:MAG: hypothetical protein ABI183_20625 [Polyangiaceae bacterium]